jgi:hypothetical protein
MEVEIVYAASRSGKGGNGGDREKPGDRMIQTNPRRSKISWQQKTLLNFSSLVKSAAPI